MIIQFIIENYYYFLLGALAIIEFVVFLIRRKPAVNQEDHIRTGLDEYLPTIINLAEKSGVDGDSKLAFVVDHCLKRIKKFICKKDYDYWKKIIVSKTEAYLSTPQKKG